MEAPNSHLPEASRRRRMGDDRGENLIEFALVSTIFFMTLFGTIIFGIGVWRYNMVADLAQEGARWASVHGSTSAVAGGPSRRADVRPEPRTFQRDGDHNSGNSGRIRIVRNGASPAFVQHVDLIAARWAPESAQRCADDRLPVNGAAVQRGHGRADRERDSVALLIRADSASRVFTFFGR